MKRNGVLILDFGSQYTKLIARKRRESWRRLFKKNTQTLNFCEGCVLFRVSIKKKGERGRRERGLRRVSTH